MALAAVSEAGAVLQHPMCAYVAGDSRLGNTSKPVSPRSIAEVPEARAVVVLIARSKDSVQRSHAFCIDKKQGILVGSAHALPPQQEFDTHTVIEVCLYNSDKKRLAPTFVAELLKEGVSKMFQDGGMDLALLRITHHFDPVATGKCGSKIDPEEIENV